MSDRYASFANSRTGKAIVGRLGLPQPPRLRRYQPGDPLTTGPVRVGGTGRLVAPVTTLLDKQGVVIAIGTSDGLGALLFDATGITEPTGLRALYDFFQPSARSLQPSARVVIFGTPPEQSGSTEEAIAQRALEGFTRSIGKELGRGSTAQLVYVAPGGEGNLRSTVEFLLSGRSAFVSGQVIRVGAGDGPLDDGLAGRVALVTGAARGIGAEIARVLAREGAIVLGVDVPAAGDVLAAVVNEVGGSALQLDLTADHAADRLVRHVRERFGQLDIVVHNAGITRDRTLGRMLAADWDCVLELNLVTVVKLTQRLLAEDLIATPGRIVGVSSITGISGNRGQTNYATTKAGVIGFAEALAPALIAKNITVNAVAPGFIETTMTDRMPVLLREASRRMNSLSQAGLPIDVAETITWLADPGSATVTGQVVRVCGQSLLGA
jgi:3-oxoacyl-[acyl-carrier protein] reductase